MERKSFRKLRRNASKRGFFWEGGGIVCTIVRSILVCNKSWSACLTVEIVLQPLHPVSPGGLVRACPVVDEGAFHVVLVGHRAVANTCKQKERKLSELHLSIFHGSTEKSFSLMLANNRWRGRGLSTVPRYCVSHRLPFQHGTVDLRYMHSKLHYS